MNNLPEKRPEPVCRFGPGGDFVLGWPVNNYQPALISGVPLINLIKSIAQTTTTLLSPELSPEPAASQASAKQQQYTRQITGYEFKNIKPGRTTSTGKNTLYAGKQLLLPDFSSAYVRNCHKPKRRYRIRQTTAEKNTSFVIPGQGSLFEEDLQSAKTA
ncbi:hypothetical protein ACFL1G_05570 [Planctomycetota bacterium]